MVKFFILFFFLITHSLFAKQNDIDTIIQMTKQQVYELELEDLQNTLSPYLKEKNHIKRLIIQDMLTKEIFIGIDQTNTKQIISNELPFACPKNLITTIKEMNYKNDLIGKVLLCTTPHKVLNTSLALTKAEQLWLKNHPIITVHNEKSWAPINFNKNGVPTGFSIDFMNLLAQKIGIEVKYVTGEWNDLYNKALNKKLDVMLNIAANKERTKYFLFTDPYLKNTTSIFARKNDQSISSIQSLYGEKVAIVTGFYHEGYLRKNFPLIQIITKQNAKETLQSVCIGETDATIGSFIVNNHIMNEIVCNNLEFKNELQTKENQTDLRIAIRNDYPELHTIFQKAIASVGSNELNKLKRKWISIDSQKSQISLTKEEMAWINENPILNVGGELDWAPFDFVDENNTYTGLTKDYLDLISASTGLEFKIHIGQTWSELLKSFKDGEYDILPAIYYSKEREQFIDFTNPYLSISDYFITKEDYPKIKNIKELFNKKVAVIKGYEITQWLKKNYPQIQLVEFDNLLQVLRSIESGTTVATIQDNPSTTYIMGKNFITTLKINNIVSNRKPTTLHMGVQKENKILINILNKALDNITREEKKQISSRWMSEIKDNSIALDFSSKEMAWLAQQPTIKFAIDPNWLPIEAINKNTNTYEGMMADYLQKIQELTGLRFELVPTKTWPDSVELAKSKKVDMLAAASMTPERQEFLNFSNTTLTLTDGVIMRSDEEFISNLSDLKGKRVGVPDATSLHDMLKTSYPELILVPIKGTINGIKSLEKGNIDAYVGNLEVASYLIFSENILNLKVVLKLDSKRELHIALHKSTPKVALSVINKAINAISNEEINLIRQKWIGLKVHDEIDYMLFVKIAIATLIIFFILAFYNRKLHKTVELKTRDIREQKQELETLLAQFDKNVIFSKTDLKGVITHVSEAFCKISGYEYNELIGKSHNIVRHPDTPKETFKLLWETLQKQACITLEIKNKKINGEYYWIEAKYEPDYDKDGNHIGYSALIVDITDKKEVEDLSKSLESKVIERTKELENERRYINSVMNSQENIVISTDGKKISTANKAFFKFFKVSSIEEFMNNYGNCICDTFDQCNLDGFIQKTNDGIQWAEYILQEPEKFHKVKISSHDGNEHIFAISVDTFQHDEQLLKVAVFSDITELETIREEIEEIHKHTKDSIEYASLIQHSLIPNNDLFRKYFSDYLTIWHPKDIIGGDIYLFDELRDDNECILMVIDCTGHGVPGAFVTMLVKAIERQITSRISHSDEIVSPAKILEIFNRSMKHLLKQESVDSISNAGFDGGILYYNKEQKLIKYAGAETPLFYTDETNQLQTIKGCRHSVGYKKSDANYKFKEHTINVKEGMQFYLTTDGYLDQNGGDKGFPFGKKRFKALIEEYKDEAFADQQEVLLETLMEYQKDEERNDDVTVVGIKI